MATFDIIIKPFRTPPLNTFEGSQPIKFSCYFQDYPNLTQEVVNYYHNGSQAEPQIGDTIYLDSAGTTIYDNPSLSVIFFKEDAQFAYYLLIQVGIVVDIIACELMDFTDFPSIQEDLNNICDVDSNYPDDLSTGEILYHDGNGDLPQLGDTIYIDYNDTLNNYFGLFNIIQDTYYYLETDSNGLVINIVTCSEPVAPTVRTLYVCRTNATTFPFTPQDVLCVNYFDFGTFEELNVYYLSDSPGLPDVNTVLYKSSDLNPASKLEPGVYYYFNNNPNGESFLVCNNHSKLNNYFNC